MIPWELYHRLVVVDLDKKGFKKDGEKATDHEKKKIWKLNKNRSKI